VIVHGLILEQLPTQSSDWQLSVLWWIGRSIHIGSTGEWWRHLRQLL